MGASGSSLIGNASPHPSLLPFTSLNLADVSSILSRHRQDLGGSFALGPRQFALLLNLNEKDSGAIFKDVFDTDRNNLVDAFEILGCAVLLSRVKINDKIDFIYNLYDFNGSGDITIDEMTILLRTLVVGAGKMDKKIVPPTTEDIEKLTVKAFAIADKDADGEISKHEFHSFCKGHPMCRNFLDFWRGSINQVVLEDAEKFCDDEFPANASSLYENISAPPPACFPWDSIVWKRPEEFCPGTPVLFSAGPNRGIVQGCISNNWFLSALGMILPNEPLCQALFVHTGQESHGRYCVRFFKEGTYVNVVVDDQFPFDRSGQPLFCSGSDKNEIWMMLVEKAYAKLHGTYSCLTEGEVSYALKDLTGGISEYIDTNKDTKFAEKVAQGKFVETLKEQLANGIVGCCNDQPPPLDEEGGPCEPENRMGVMKGSCYAVCDVKEFPEQKVVLVKINNPWGFGSFNGDWSNESLLWADHPDISRQCFFKQTEKNVSWLTLKDFFSLFNVLHYCKLFNEETYHFIRRKGFFVQNGGGCVNYPTWVQNDQFLLDVEDEDVKISITLTQKDSLYHKDQQQSADRPAMGIIVHKHNFGDINMENTPKLLSMKSTDIVMSSNFSGSRSVSCSGSLGIGRYAILPQTFDPNTGVEFWLTINSTVPVNVYGGIEVDWDPAMLASDLEGDNEMEQNLTKTAVEKEDVREVDTETQAFQLASKMVADLTVKAQKLAKRKAELEAKIGELNDRVAAAELQ